MTNISSSLTSYLFGLLTSQGGLEQELLVARTLVGSPASGGVHSISVQNSSPELAERGQNVRYPAIYIYCERLTNSLKEKFAIFSGKGRLVIEVRCSQDRIEGIERVLECYTDAVCRVLDGARGAWQDGAYYTGGYDVLYGALKQGGKNVLQTARITFDVEVSR